MFWIKIKVRDFFITILKALGTLGNFSTDLAIKLANKSLADLKERLDYTNSQLN